MATISNNSVKIFFLNCRSLCNKLGEVKSLIYQSNPDVFCFGETWISRFEPKFREYVAIWKHRGGPGGGLGILIRDSIPYQAIELVPFDNGYLEVLAVKIVLENNVKLGILNIYNPNKAVTANELSHYVSQLGADFLVVGDLNAHTSLLDSGCGRGNFAGRSLETFISDDHACLINPMDLYTYISPATGRGSCLDVCLSSPTLASVTSLARGVDVGSDHVTMIAEVLMKPKINTSVGVVKYVERSDEEVRRYAEEIQSSSLVQPNDLDTMVEDFTTRLITSADQHITKTSGRPRKFRSTPWWSRECRRLVAVRRKLRRILELHPSRDNLDDYNEATLAAKEFTDKRKKDSFREYISTLTYDTPTGSVWKKFKSFKSSYVPSTYPLENNDRLVVDVKEKADLLAGHFADNSVIVPGRIDDLNEVVNRAESCGDEEDYNCDLQISELDTALSKPRKTAAGSDKIPYFLLRALKPESRLELLNIFNQSYTTGEVPAAWKIGTVIPISKPGKDPRSKESYRPITLLSCTSKVLERIIQRRLEYVIEKRQYLKPEQGGFRRATGTGDVLSRFGFEIKSTLASKKISLVIYLDLKSAFDRVWCQGLVYKLAKLGLRGKLLRWIENYLKNRKLQVRVNGQISDMTDVGAGTPQGAVCSPILFNLMLSDIPEQENIKLYIFADDITVVCTGTNLHDITNQMQNYLNRFYEWTVAWALSINPSKTFLQMFTRKRITPPKIYLMGQEIENKREQRLLGMIFDAPLLTWRAHIENLKVEGIKRINIMKCVASPVWGASGRVIKQFYTAYVRAKLDYGSHLYASAAATHLNKLESVQNAGLRMILGARKSTPAISLQAEAGLPSLKLRRVYLILKEFIRIMYRPEGDYTVKILGLEAGLAGCQIVPPGSFLSVVRDYLGIIDIQVDRIPTELFHIVPPWRSVSEYVSLEQDESLRCAASVSNYLENNYPGYKIIFTDGSKTIEPSESVASAVFVDHLKQVSCWKVGSGHSVIFAELYALLQALKMIRNDNHQYNWVVLTDSLSSLALIAGCSRSYIAIINEIQQLLIELNEVQQVVLHWVKAHSGIRGNEIADRAANLGHNNAHNLALAPTREESCSILLKQFNSYWNSQWLNEIAVTGKGHFLATIRDDVHQKLTYNFKNRRMEAIIHRLRMGHAGLNSYLHRFQMSDSEECDECGVPETIEHYLLYCHKYMRQRFLFSARLRFIDINIIDLNLKLVLGGSIEHHKNRNKIINVLTKFLQSTDKVDNL